MRVHPPRDLSRAAAARWSIRNVLARFRRKTAGTCATSRDHPSIVLSARASSHPGLTRFVVCTGIWPRSLCLLTTCGLIRRLEMEPGFAARIVPCVGGLSLAALLAIPLARIRPNWPVRHLDKGGWTLRSATAARRSASACATAGTDTDRHKQPGCAICRDGQPDMIVVQYTCPATAMADLDPREARAGADSKPGNSWRYSVFAQREARIAAAAERPRGLPALRSC